MATHRGIEPLPSDRQSGTLPLRQWANFLFNLHQFFVGVNHFFQVVINFFIRVEDLSSILAYDANGMTVALYKTKPWESTITEESCVPSSRSLHRVMEVMTDV
jgi:hypothetical protein